MKLKVRKRKSVATNLFNCRWEEVREIDADGKTNKKWTWLLLHGATKSQRGAVILVVVKIAIAVLSFFWVF